MLLLTILCIIEVRFFVSSVVLKSPPERKAEKRYPNHFMKYILFILLFSLSSTCFSQSSRIQNVTLTDSVFKVLLNGAGIELTKSISVLKKSSEWSLSTFYFQPKLEGQHLEGVNLFVYNDSFVNNLINKNQWSFFSHRALAQKQTKYRKTVSLFPIARNIQFSDDLIYFQTTKPVIVDSFAIVDISYYVPTKQDSIPEQSYRGQAFVVLEKNQNEDWEIRKIINRVLW